MLINREKAIAAVEANYAVSREDVIEALRALPVSDGVTDEMPPCRICGGEGVVSYSSGIVRTGWEVECAKDMENGDGSHGTGLKPTEAEAIAAWQGPTVSDGWEDIARDALESVLEDYENMLKWPLPSPRDYEKVVSLGEEIGYGSLMVMASQAWREVLGVHAGGEFVAGPCRATAEKALAKIRAALGPLPAPPTIEEKA